MLLVLYGNLQCFIFILFFYAYSGMFTGQEGITVYGMAISENMKLYQSPFGFKYLTQKVNQ